MDEEKVINVNFNGNDLVVIWADQREQLENIHVEFEDNKTPCDLINCPPSHFDMSEDIEEVFLRQGIVKKILSALDRELKEREKKKG
jgi:hypothetical protein